MNARYVLLVAIGLLLLASAADLAWHLPRMPERLATHFGLDGQADGWTSRSSFALTQVGILVLLPAVFVGLSFLIPRLPTALINVPNRDFWLAPERRAYTMETISRFLLVLGLLLMVFLAGLMHLIMRANLEPTPKLIWGLNALVVTQLIAMGVAVIWMLLRFRRPR